MPKIIEAYRSLKKRLQEAGIEEAEAEARLILADSLGISLGDIFLQADRSCTVNFDEILRKRLAGMPLAYAMNRKYFMGLPFYVDENVLIPRQDTEILAEKALDSIRENKYGTVLDLCCGSGCIGVSIEKLANVRVIGSDISPAAVDIANKNARALGTKNYRAVVSDLFDTIEGKFDLIVCNPPYVTEEEYGLLELQVREYEPKTALVGSVLYYQKIAPYASGFLHPGGMLIFEIGCTQREDVEKILKENHYKNISCLQDLAGRHRVIACTTN